MKIVCDSCGAKYSIADEKVAGKVFKIRCKKCSEVIVVRGDEMQAQAAAPAPEPEAQQADAGGGDYGGGAEAPAGDALWHIVVDGNQQGPYTPQQVGEFIAAGQMDWDGYVWREGFDNWLPARDIEELVTAITGGGGGQEQQQQQDQMFSDAPTAMSASPFEAQQAGGMFGSNPFDAQAPMAARAGRGAGGDLFGGAAETPFGGGGQDEEDDGIVSSAHGGSPRVSADQASMTGARNENSVLFSLSNLQALATGTGSSPGSSAAPAPAAKGGMAQGEGSGLIDIRALASATSMSSSNGSAAKNSVDDLLSIGPAAAPFGGGLGAPILAPARNDGGSKGLFIGIGVGVLGIAAAAAAVVVVLNKEPEPAAPAAPATALGAIVPTTPTTNPNEPAGGAQAGSPSQPAPNQAANGEDTAEREHTGGGGGGGGGRPRPRTGGGGGGGGRNEPAAEARPAPEAPSRPAGGGGGNSIDSLLEKALGGGGGGGGGGPSRPARPDPEPSGGGDLPEAPSRDQVMSALRSVQSAVEACGGGQHGLATTSIVISGSTGRVTTANVTGTFAGTPAGSCVARAARNARFPRFSRPTFNVNYPFRL